MKHNTYKSADINSEIRKKIQEDIQRNLDKFKDPVVIGELTFQLLKERESTNQILKNLLQRIDQLELKVMRLGELQTRSNKYVPKTTRSTDTKRESNGILLPEIDERILSYVKKKISVVAEDIRKAFNYRGKNAASARLNRLYQMGLLGKKQSGRKVYFFIDK